MKHEIDLQKYQIRTDLAIEVIGENNKIKGIISKQKKIDDIKVTAVWIDEYGSKQINKKKGNYITIEFKDVTDYNNSESVKAVFVNELKELIDKNNILDSASCLIVGLGNYKSTPDSLGPKVIKDIIVTNHLFMYGEVEDGFRKTFALNPGVMGTTGVETSELIKAIVNTIKPDFVIAVDALASQSIERVNKTIQMTDTGIHPGSGVGNSRKEISFDTLGIPVIAIGVPTVVDAVTIVSDTINYMFKHYTYTKNNINNPSHKLVPTSSINYLNSDIKVTDEDKRKLMGIVGNLEENEIKQLIFEVLTPIGYNLMVTPKEIDFLMDKLSNIISDGINICLHEKVDN
ncbi:MAG: GPR endopeptidase [Firmicutes bacterium]|nr:GPR endopeptidase [Bacillota bacterium]